MNKKNKLMIGLGLTVALGITATVASQHINPSHKSNTSMEKSIDTEETPTEINKNAQNSKAEDKIDNKDKQATPSNTQTSPSPSKTKPSSSSSSPATSSKPSSSTPTGVGVINLGKEDLSNDGIQNSEVVEKPVDASGVDIAVRDKVYASINNYVCNNYMTWFSPENTRDINVDKFIQSKLDAEAEQQGNGGVFEGYRFIMDSTRYTLNNTSITRVSTSSSDPSVILQELIKGNAFTNGVRGTGICSVYYDSNSKTYNTVIMTYNYTWINNKI